MSARLGGVADPTPSSITGEHQEVAVHSGATIPIKLQLCDGSGNDLSSSSIVVHASSVTQIFTSASSAVENAGNSNPDDNFRFDATLGSTGGYIFNLKTIGTVYGDVQRQFHGDGRFVCLRNKLRG